MFAGIIDSFRSFKPKRINGLDMSYIPFKQPGVDGKLKPRRIIAMCAPSKGSMYDTFLRNDADAVAAYLDSTHPHRYRIYNLTEEPHPDSMLKKFKTLGAGGSVHVPIPDHQVPRFTQLVKFCQDVATFMDSDESNVPVIHCKAGKGRTGTMAVAYMLYVAAFPTIEETMNAFAVNRSQGTAPPPPPAKLTPTAPAPDATAAAATAAIAGTDNKSNAPAAAAAAPTAAIASAAAAADDSASGGGGNAPRGVDQASQVRWLYDWNKLLVRTRAEDKKNGGVEGIAKTVAAVDAVKRTLTSVFVRSLPNYDADGGCDPFLVLKSWGAEKDKYRPHLLPAPILRIVKQFTDVTPRRTPQNNAAAAAAAAIPAHHQLPPILEFPIGDLVISGETVLQCWDRDLVSDEPMCRVWFHPGMIENDRLILSKGSIDDAWNSSNFTPTFRIELVFAPLNGAAPATATAADSKSNGTATATAMAATAGGLAVAHPIVHGGAGPAAAPIAESSATATTATVTEPAPVATSASTASVTAATTPAAAVAAAGSDSTFYDINHSL